MTRLLAVVHYPAGLSPQRTQRTQRLRATVRLTQITRAVCERLAPLGPRAARPLPPSPAAERARSRGSRLHLIDAITRLRVQRASRPRSQGYAAVPSVVTFSLVVALMSACNRDHSAHEVRFWAMGREGEVVRQLMPDFERRHPGVAVRVQQIPWSAAHEKLLTAHVGGALPDVFQAGNTWLPELVA